MGNLGFSELLVILVIALLILGPKRLPDLARSLGEAVRAFRAAMSGEERGSDSKSDDEKKDHDRIGTPPIA